MTADSRDLAPSVAGARQGERVAAMSTRDALLHILAMVDIAPIARGHSYRFVPDLSLAFVVSRADFLIGSCVLDTRWPRVAVRHAVELAVQIELSPNDLVLAGLMAARCAALFAALEIPAEVKSGTREQTFDHSLFAAAQAPSFDALRSQWQRLRVYQPDAPSIPSAETLAKLGSVWRLLGPTEYLLGSGGDVRLSINPATGLNAYGCSPRPRSWAVTFASSTASSISERGYAQAEQARLRILRGALEHSGEWSELEATEQVRQGLREHYGLVADVEIVLTPSGTDGELCALAVACMKRPLPKLVNVLVGAEESGAGVPLAAQGRHFSSTTARGSSVSSGALITGFPSNIELVNVPVRDGEGRMRPLSEVDGDCERLVEAASQRGDAVLLHVIDQSKTGIVAPREQTRIAARQAGVDIVVDACQARLSAESVRGYLESGAMVLVTGSKFFTGPPFAGALLVPRALAARMRRPGDELPTGLQAYFGRNEWPSGAVACAALGGSNIGLCLRWEAALAEMNAFAAVPRQEVADTLRQFGETVIAAIERGPLFHLHDAPTPRRDAQAAEWERLQTIFTFSIQGSSGPNQADLLSLEEARAVYLWLNSDLAECLRGRVSDTEQLLAARLFHIGQPVRLQARAGKTTGALRISAGARLVSGEPSRAHLPRAERLASETDDALAALEKIDLILKHWDLIAAADPKPIFSPGSS
ncbi:MAG: hypothetical protein JWN04_3305 [Myxococcaceae bacterium]|nr:hypothetical protein [Myxococcaceae bacterium]